MRTKQFLISVAQCVDKSRRKIPEKEIKERLKRLKKLSTKYEQPLQMQKELSELERNIRGVFKLEKVLKENDKKERAEISSLKRQVTILKQKIATAEDTELRKKVDKLSFLMGDLMARHETQREIHNKKIIRKAIKSKQKEPVIPLRERIKKLETKVTQLKIAGQVPPEQLAAYDQRILAMKEKLQKKREIKHTMMMKAP
tara:strand:+ start:193 stop:792 length:600 start_codon:yes stop_codon:yes gene_type:complete